MVAFAIHIPELKEVHESTTSARFAKVLTGIARAISETLLGTQAFMSYIGEANSCAFDDHTRLMEITALQSELAMVLSEDEYVPSGVAEGGLSVIVGPACVPKAL